MNAQVFFNSKYGLAIAMAIGRFLPPQIGLRLSDRLATTIANMENTNIVKAIKANQWVIEGQKDLSSETLKEKAKAVLKHSGRCYYDLYHTLTAPEKVLQLCPNSEVISKLVTMSHEKKGVFIVAPHTSNFDLALHALALHGLKATLLGHANPFTGYKVQNKSRDTTGMKILPLSEANAFSKAVKILKDGGVVATGVDRPVKVRKKKHMISFFGRPSALPVGYIQVALAAGVPILVLSSQMRPNGTYKILRSDILPLKRHPNRFTEIKQNAEMVLRVVADYIKQAPEQWLMYYPVWPDVVEKLP